VEFGAFLLLFLLLRELVREVEAFFGVRFARCGECLRGLMAVLVSKQLSTATLYVSERRQCGGRVEGVWSECHSLKLPRF
jgi:hypothetical protein